MSFILELNQDSCLSDFLSELLALAKVVRHCLADNRFLLEKKKGHCCNHQKEEPGDLTGDLVGPADVEMNGANWAL